MANLPEVAQWGEEEDGIYQFELEDFITGGPGGNDNEPHRLLANRTRFLKERQEQILSDLQQVGGFKNLLSNADFSCNQDGSTHTSVQPLTYVCDRWVVNIGDWQHTEPSCDVLVENGVLKIYNNSHPSTYEMRVRQPIRFVNGKSLIENGETYTVSVWAKADAGVEIKVNIFHAEHLSWDGDTSVTEGVLGVGTGDWERYSLTFTANTLPNASEKATIVAFLAKGNSLEIKKPQLEKNDKATEFEYVPKEITRQICLADYETGHGSLIASSASLHAINIQFKITKNINPIVDIYSLGNVKNSVSIISDSGSSVGTVSALATNDTSSFRATISGLSANQHYMYKWVADARFY